MFSRLELTDDDTYLNTPISPELGDIRLKITEVRLMERSRNAKTRRLAETDKIHERAKKGSGHRVKFGDEIARREVMYRKYIKIRTLGTFIFKYRPLAVLQANGIAPKEHTRNTAVVLDEVLDLTLDDDSTGDRKPDTVDTIRRLEEELRILKGSEGAAQTTKKVKTEVKTKPRNLLQSGEIIDLT